MKITFNIEKLKEVMKDFYSFTGIVISLFDSKFNFVTDGGKWQDYCQQIEKRTDRAACTACNRENLMLAQTYQKTHIYTCHAGIIETIVPIFLKDQLVAYLMIGKFRDAAETFSNEKMALATADRYGLDRASLLADYKKLPLLTEDAINSAIRLMKYSISYLLAQNYIQANREPLSQHIEEYIESRINEKITVDSLCLQFHVSRVMMYKIFKEDFNDNVLTFIHKKRLFRAQQLLSETKRSPQKIAEELGFPSYRYFVRFFKKQTGLSPAQYRNNALKI